MTKRNFLVWILALSSTTFIFLTFYNVYTWLSADNIDKYGTDYGVSVYDELCNYGYVNSSIQTDLNKDYGYILILFEPDCPTCRSRLNSIKKILAKENDWIQSRIIFITKAEYTVTMRYLDSHNMSQYSLISSGKNIFKKANIRIVPIYILLDSEATIIEGSRSIRGFKALVKLIKSEHLN